jgi:hypothetical protein
MVRGADDHEVDVITRKTTKDRETRKGTGPVLRLVRGGAGKQSGRRVDRARARVVRYRDAKALLNATRGWCIDQVRQRSEGRIEWTDGLEDQVKRSIRVSDEARETAIRIVDALRNGDRFLAENALRADPYNDGNVDTIERVVHLLKETPSTAFTLEGPTPHHWTPRAILVANYWTRRDLWWNPAKPKRRDLAILSLLVGHGREWAKGGRVATVMDAVRAEDNAIARHVKRLFSRPRALEP